MINDNLSTDGGGDSRELENDDEFLHKSPDSRNSPEISLGKYVRWLDYLFLVMF